MHRHLLAVPAALIALSLLPAVATAGAACPKQVAKLSGDAAGVTHFHKGAPEGEPLDDAKVRFPGHFYKADGTVKLRLKGNTYRIGEGSIFKLNCYGRSKADKHLLPSLDLMRGEAVVTTAKRNPGGVLTTEGLFDPRKDPTMTFTVKRTLAAADEPTAEDIFKWFAGFLKQPNGTTEVSSAGPIVGVTPYVGARPGSCRYVHKAKLTSKGTKGSYHTGTASYTP